LADIFEGRWEDLAGRQDLHGRWVRGVVLDEGEERAGDPWLKSLRAWMDSHEAIAGKAGDSRGSFYSGTSEDPR